MSKVENSAQVLPVPYQPNNTVYSPSIKELHGWVIAGNPLLKEKDQYNAPPCIN